MTTFRWTPRRREELRQLRKDGFSWADVGTMLGCGREEAIAEDRRQRKQAQQVHAVAIVPRPAPAPPPPGIQRKLIDLSNAPSAMEEAAKRWAKQ